MQIVEVTTDQHRKQFLRFPIGIYKNDPNWSQPLNRDIEAVFDPAKNKFFRHGECTRFLAIANGQVTGRVAAFINHKLANRETQPTGGMGFFECVKDQSTAFALFDACKNWLKTRGMEAMDGPINFGERDSWWGLLVDGASPVPYKMNYNPPYYRDFFENYGFRNYFEQWCFSLKVSNRLQDKFYERHDKLASDPRYSATHLKKSQLAKYAEDFRTIYNKAWVSYGEGRELEEKQVLLAFKKMKPVMDEKIIWFAYYDGQPVATWINLPDVNSIFRKFHGRFGCIEKIRFFISLKRREVRKMIGMIFGIVPEHQGKGVDAFMIVEAAKIIQGQKLYDDLEMQWIADFNPKMVAIGQSLGAHRTRTLITYRYLFDPTQEFKRHPILK